MPDFRDLLPQPPWEGPPVPRGIVSGNPDTGEEKAMPEIERVAGFVVRVGGIEVREVMLPDWSLYYIEYPPGKRAEYRAALTWAKARVRTVKFTDKRIYFEQ